LGRNLTGGVIMDIALSFDELNSMLKSSAQLGAMEAMRNLNPQADEISRKDAENRFGKKWIKHHLEKGTIKPARKSGAVNAKMYLSISEMMRVRESERNFELILKFKKVKQND
jgi:ribosomal protein L9